MTAERDFLVWFATKQFMVVKKHRPEVRAHLVKALASVDTLPKGEDREDGLRA